MSMVFIIVLLHRKDMFTVSPLLTRYFETKEKQPCKKTVVVVAVGVI